MRKYLNMCQRVRVNLMNHGTSEYNAEVCGLLAGTFIEDDGVVIGANVEDFFPIRNVAPDPAARFIADPYEYRNVYNLIYKSGLQAVANFHTHPHGYPIPSQIDKNEIRDEQFWIILGHRDMSMRAYWPLVENKEFKPVDILFK